MKLRPISKAELAEFEAEARAYLSGKLDVVHTTSETFCRLVREVIRLRRREVTKKPKKEG